MRDRRAALATSASRAGPAVGIFERWVRAAVRRLRPPEFAPGAARNHARRLRVRRRGARRSVARRPRAPRGLCCAAASAGTWQWDGVRHGGVPAPAPETRLDGRCGRGSPQPPAPSGRALEARTPRHRPLLVVDSSSCNPQCCRPVHRAPSPADEHAFLWYSTACFVRLSHFGGAGSIPALGLLPFVCFSALRRGAFQAWPGRRLQPARQTDVDRR